MTSPRPRAAMRATTLLLLLGSIGCTGDKVTVLEDDVDSASPDDDSADTADTGEPVEEPDPGPWDSWLDTASLPGGTFEMGCTRDDEWSCYDNEFPVRELTLSPIEVLRTEVPRGMYRALTGGAHRPAGCTQDDCVAVNISWYDAVAFCNLASEAAGLTPAYSISGTTVTWDRTADGWRLPTEAEWEYAARGGRDLIYAGSADLDQVAWTRENAGGRPHEVGEKAENDFDLHDMSGNVWEWVWDWQGSYDASSTVDPTGPDSGERRILRGGAWDANDDAARVSFRGAMSPDTEVDTNGLRIVRGALAR